MNFPNVPGGLDRLMSAQSDASAAQGAICTLLGFGFGYILAQEQLSQQQVNQAPKSRNPYRNSREIVTVLDLEEWVLENEARLPNAPVILRHLGQMPDQARLDQQTVRNLLTASR